MPNPMEGLCYLINTDGDNPEQKFSDFINFCQNGRPGPGPGGFAMIAGEEVRGVLDWLVRLPVLGANFFRTDANAAGTVFVATISPETDVPWIRIPAFMDFVKQAPLPNFADQNGQIKLRSILSLDDEMKRRVDVRNQVLHLVPTEVVKQFSSALGETRSQNEAISQLEEPLRGRVKELLGLS